VSGAVAPLVEARAVRRVFSSSSRTVTAVDDVSLQIMPGETFGLVGESGSGKSTLSALLLALDRPTSGTVTFEGRDLATLGGRELRRTRRRMQMVFQDPVGALNRRKTVEQIVGTPLHVHLGLDKAARRARVRELLGLVGLREEHAGRYPRELSGGQCQRVGIARAIATEPSFVILDEAVSAVDVSVQAQILNLLNDLQQRLGLTYLFVSHDLAVVRYMSARLAVMHDGVVVEEGTREQIFGASGGRHPYTSSLLDAIPVPVPGRATA
jgi:ABC-type oligopeptide transport system ATPase subunit